MQALDCPLFFFTPKSGPPRFFLQLFLKNSHFMFSFPLTLVDIYYIMVVQEDNSTHPKGQHNARTQCKHSRTKPSG
jgi:hypothetical protein